MLKESDVLSRMAALHIPAAQVVVIDSGAASLDLSEGTGISSDTLFQAASVSKPVTAMAAMLLVQRGVLSLDEDVNRKLHSWHVPSSSVAHGQPVTLRRLLSHSAGTTVAGFGGYPDGERLPRLTDVLDGHAPANNRAVRVDIQPGKLSRYSGGGYAIVQQLMVDASRKPFDRLMHEAILAPLGMSRSSFTQPPPDRLRNDAARAHLGDGKPYAFPWTNHPEMSAAGLWTTATDLSKIVLEMQSAVSGHGKLLRQPTATQMLTIQSGKMGLGWGLEGIGRGLRFHHAGTNRGYRAQITATAHTGQGVVVMTNSDAGHGLAADIVRRVSVEWPQPDGDDHKIGSVGASEYFLEFDR